MTDFVTQVVLKDAADDAAYARLDEVMTTLNFSRTIVSSRGISYDLPRGTYFSQSQASTSADVRDLALGAVLEVGVTHDIMTTSGDMAYFLRPQTT